MKRLEGKVAVITGGASGIGAATARLFHAEGARVVVGDIQDELGKQLVEECGDGVVYQHADVTDEDEIRALMLRGLDAFGRLDIAFNNAGIGGARGPITETSADELDATMAVLFRAVFLGIKHAAAIMKANGSGSIISTASVAGVQAGLGPFAYSAAKAAVVHLTRCVAVELAADGIRVNCIAPGGIVTPLLTQAAGEGEQATAMVTGFLSRLQPIQRAGMPDDIARTALWLASDESSFVTAQTIVVDGGLTAGRPPGGMAEANEVWDPSRAPGSKL